MLLYVNQLQVKASVPILQFRSRCIKLMHFLGLSTVVVHAAQPYFAQRKRAFEPRNGERAPRNRANTERKVASTRDGAVLPQDFRNAPATPLMPSSSPRCTLQSLRFREAGGFP
ncbi:hypothetical protein BUPH_08392 (plasmid) [Paraburkholderia phenoliruptrix BR3459a]|uniref:Uncharacterized protein n=1 Tax=Paraburkholderia phenoliruptrix BR3459a TaxID=1229205 RepID=K0DZR5_9BURK|nr:hypothetical protein BUPH_08392 [Paraburkholderia phenoliruptrix BR3459a]